MQMVHGMRTEVVQRDDAGDDRSESGGNSRIAHVANMTFAFDVEVVNFRLESFANLGGGARKINQHPTGIDHVDAETMGLEPAGDGVKIGLRQAEALAKFLGAKPMMEVWRTFDLEFVDELLYGLFLFRRALQLEQHVLHGEIVRHDPAIVCGPRFGAGVAREGYAICFIDALGNSGASMHAGFDLCANGRCGDKSGDGNRGEEPQFARHGSPYLYLNEIWPQAQLGADDGAAKHGRANQQLEWSRAPSSWLRTPDKTWLISARKRNRNGPTDIPT